MKLILSRKGFDAGAGGCPSPIFPDGSMLALPIPDPRSRVRYRDIAWSGGTLADLLPLLAGARPRAGEGAHLDPDVRFDAVPRDPDWRPIFGQHGSAWGHLRNRGVGAGDLFLFFGLFREVDGSGAFVPRAAARHVIWGWLQVEEILPVDPNRTRLSWARYHPHLAREADPANVVILATSRLAVPGASERHGRKAFLSGAGVFPRYRPALQLTAADRAGVSTWRLPSWFHPAGRASSLSYHGDSARWTREGDAVLLRSVGRGQEFVLDGDDYPELLPWAAQLIGQGSCAETDHPAVVGPGRESR
jgi:hypothetical protein